MKTEIEELRSKVDDLENRLEESEQLIEAIKSGEVDAFAISSNDQSEVYTLQTGDYAYRVLIEEFGEGAINVTEEGMIVYTNPYFFELLDLPYEEVIGCMILDFVHEDSTEKFNRLFKQALTDKSKGEINLYVNGKIIPVYISLTSLQPTLATIGIITTDLTEKKRNEEVILKYQKDLEVKNQELLQSNAELAAFAYIASHDLQEPLRKIQTFSNRIIEREPESFSDATKDYFQRIIAASKRMQNLISSLLNYSRLNTSHVIDAPTDLNKIVEDVKSDLRELIDEHNAVIETSSLPTLKVVPHQFNQLFSNIIINSIKFRKPDVNPLIKIQASKSEDQNWKIQISDNGIGFDQTYSDKIFELFQRLHGRSEYDGTGIGLSICKKIVQNHGGFIKATGEKGVGSIFSVFLPAMQ